MSKIDFISFKTIDFCDDVRDGTHDSPKHLDFGKILITSKNIKGDSIDFENASYISEEDYNKINERSLVEINDVLYSMIGTVGLVYRVDQQPNYAIKNMGLFKIHDELKSKWLYYYLNSPKAKGKVLSMLSGSTQKFISLGNLRNLEIEFPQNIDDAKKIIKICESIDRKIKLNNEINNNLYDMLKRLYKELYLNNPSYNTWESMTLNDVTCKFATGLNPRKNFVLGQGNNYYVTIKNMPNNQVILDDKCDKVDDEALIKINKRSDLKVGDLLFSGIGTIGRTYLIKSKPTNWNISESVFTIRPNDKISSEFLYLLLLDSDMQNYAVSKASGSVQKGIRMADLKLYKLKVPGKEWMDTFTNTISPLIDKIYLNYEMNEKLCRLRDTLLPKLMNGEIDLDNIEI